MLLLDTDVMIDLLRQYPPAVAWLDSLGEEEIVLPGFVVMELMQGCRNKQEQEKMEGDLAAYSVAWPTSATCDAASSVFARYHLSHGLGILDALIGQMAVALHVPLHTFNQKHYVAIPHLITMQPYEKASRH
jgi:predicted nucleic acid-binding protein